MPTITPQDLQAEADVMIRFWTNHPEMKLKDVTLEQLKEDIARFDTMLGELDVQEEVLTVLRNNRDELSDHIVDTVIRIRTGIKSYYGSDSTEYELAGGTRKSDRKRPVHTAKANTNPPAAA